MKILSILNQTKKNPLKFLFFLLVSTSCTINPYLSGTLSAVSSQSLSILNPELKTCIFDPQYSIVHFPMFHVPPNGYYSKENYEEVAQSQFQLLHTTIAYNRSGRPLALFDEGFISDLYNEEFLQQLTNGEAINTITRLDKQTFSMTERLHTAKSLFPTIPRYYEHLTEQQKDFLYNSGSSLTLYLLGEVPKIHKVATEADWDVVKINTQDISGILQLTEQNNYWIFDFREQALQQQVFRFINSNYNPQTLILIAYGKAHDLSNEFSAYQFQSGHNFCLNWRKYPNQPLP